MQFAQHWIVDTAVQCAMCSSLHNWIVLFQQYQRNGPPNTTGLPFNIGTTYSIYVSYLLSLWMHVCFCMYVLLCVNFYWMEHVQCTLFTQLCIHLCTCVCACVIVMCSLAHREAALRCRLGKPGVWSRVMALPSVPASIAQYAGADRDSCWQLARYYWYTCEVTIWKLPNHWPLPLPVRPNSTLGKSRDLGINTELLFCITVYW